MKVDKSTIKDFYPKTRKEWRKWLQKNYDKEYAIWLIFYKKGSNMPSIAYADAVEEALCFGWIDSVPNKIDDKKYKQMFSQRKKKSVWSKINKERIEKLIKENLMHEAGLTKIEEAKKDGSWTTIDNIEELIMPEVLRKAFSNNKKALKFFEAFPKSVKKAIYFWVESAKTPETLKKRITETVTLAKENKRANQYVKKTDS